MEETSRPIGRAPLVFVFASVALDMVALGIVLPVLPSLVLQFEGGDVAQASRLTGLLSTAWATMQLLAAPVLGALSDRYGRRPVLLLSNLGLCLDYWLMAVAPNLAWLFVGRLLSGVTSASFATAGAYVADVTPPHERAARFGLLGATMGVGFIVGPGAAGWLGGMALRSPFWAASALSLINFAYGSWLLPESLPEDKRRPFCWRRASPLGTWQLFRSSTRLRLLGWASAVHWIAHGVLPSVFVLYTGYRYGWRTEQVGQTLALIGGLSMLVSTLLVGRMVPWIGERRTLLFGLLGAWAGLLFYGLAPTGAWFVAGAPLVALWGLVGPALQSQMSHLVDSSSQGQLQGALGSLRGVAGLVSPLLFTQVFAFAVDPAKSWALPGAPYLVAIVLLGLVLVLSAKARAPEVLSP